MQSATRHLPVLLTISVLSGAVPCLGQTGKGGDRPVAVAFSKTVLVRATSVIHSKPEGGVWTDASTWVEGVVPTEEDSVVITAGSTVTLDHDGQRDAGWLTIEQSAVLVASERSLLGVHNDLSNAGLIRKVAGDRQESVIGVQGTFHNPGVLSYAGSFAPLSFELHGSVDSRGRFAARAFIMGESPRSLWFADSDSISAWFQLADFELVGQNRLLTAGFFFFFDPSASIRVSPEASVAFSPGFDFPACGGHGYLNFETLAGELRFRNFGTSYAVIDSVGWRYDLGVEISDGSRSDTVFVTSYPKQTHPKYATGLRRWWHLESTSPDLSLKEICFTFDMADLANSYVNDKEKLEVFHSSDGGATWRQVSNDQNVLTRFFNDGFGFGEPGEGYISLSDDDFPATGDYVLAEIEPATVRSSLYLDIIGRPEVPVLGRPSYHLIQYANTGTATIGPGLMGIRTEDGVFIERILPSDTDGIEWDKSVFSPDGDSTSALLVSAPLAPGQSRNLRVWLRSSPDLVGTDKKAAAPIVVAGVVYGLGIAFFQDWALNTMGEVLKDPCFESGPIKDKIKSGLDKSYDNLNPFRSEMTVGAAAGSIAGEIDDAGYLKSTASRLGTAGLIVGGAQQVVDAGNSFGWDRKIDCDDEPVPPNSTRRHRELRPVNSIDPNAKSGAAGVGPRGFLRSSGEMTYLIQFENKAEATAPAFRVVITDTLGDEFEPATVRRGDESHEGFTFTRTENILQWAVEGIDLPPNVNPPEGEGWVTFSVSPKVGRPTGTELLNGATIVFDLNEPLSTNRHLNTLDFEGPTTATGDLPATVPADSLNLSWEADDAGGSGVMSTAVYASVDAGAFEHIGTAVGSSARVGVLPDRSYRFYALSVDSVGNAEQIPGNIVETRTMAGTSSQQETPFEFALGQNYPNPFNPVTLIAFSVPTRGQARLVVYDVLGREVARLVDGLVSSGPHQVEWDARQAASGLYFYRLEHGEKKAVGKMMLVK